MGIERQSSEEQRVRLDDKYILRIGIISLYVWGYYWILDSSIFSGLFAALFLFASLVFIGLWRKSRGLLLFQKKAQNTVPLDRDQMSIFVFLGVALALIHSFALLLSGDVFFATSIFMFLAIWYFGRKISGQENENVYKFVKFVLILVLVAFNSITTSGSPNELRRELLIIPYLLVGWLVFAALNRWIGDESQPAD